MGTICGKSANAALSDPKQDEPPESESPNPTLLFHAKFATIKLLLNKKVSRD